MRVESSHEVKWIYGIPNDRYSKMLLLHKDGCAYIGCYDEGLGLIAWCPFPKRDKKLEETLTTTRKWNETKI